MMDQGMININMLCQEPYIMVANVSKIPSRAIGRRVHSPGVAGLERPTTLVALSGRRDLFASCTHRVPWPYLPRVDTHFREHLPFISWPLSSAIGFRDLGGLRPAVVPSNLYSLSLSSPSSQSNQIQLFHVGTRRASSEHLRSACQQKDLGKTTCSFLIVTAGLKYRVHGLFLQSSRRRASIWRPFSWESRSIIDRHVSYLHILLYNPNRAIRRRHSLSSRLACRR
ncbi:hypothetical protein CONLIGDRAFT_6235 [Coniochaeta ligniaria NRRL 30616]|uniref:Uncharacterized protein n=1 Tax=Coniochaeta ligniaria NRRL 30616 TaxID=1408157 RepID=A0A1J7J4T3_9PEZI|nr:hypothetical protein CONLIGDRAFT_6235 [Coniochaeta ligniaria NRRL 30616]